MHHVTFSCLALLTLIPLLKAFELNFGQIVRLLGIALGLAWLLWRDRGLLDALVKGASFGRVILPSLFMSFVLSEFVWDEGRVARWEVLSCVVAGLSLVSACVDGKTIRDLTGREYLGLVFGGSVAFSAMGLWYHYSLIFKAGNSTFLLKAIFWAAFISIVYSLYVCGYSGRAKKVGRRLLFVLLGVFLCVSALGVGRIGYAGYHKKMAVHSFANGSFDNAQRHLELLLAADLNYAPLSSESAMDEILTLVEIADTVEGYVGFAEIATGLAHWELARIAYEKALTIDVGSPLLQLKLNNVLFEQGAIIDALAYFRQRAEEGDVEGQLALAIALIRVADWDGAKLALSRFLENDDLGAELLNLAAQGMISGQVQDLIPQRLMPYLQKLTLFDVVSLGRALGWKVLHPSSTIGRTGVETPVDIVAVSGGGASSNIEGIAVAGRNISPHELGHNIAVIDPQTGTLDTTAFFHTNIYWQDDEQSKLLAKFLDSIPEKKIVAMTIKGSARAMTEIAQKPIQSLGGRAIGGADISHALIGIKGADKSNDAVGMRGVAVRVGVLAGNIAEQMRDDPVLLKAELIEAARDISGGIAIYISGLRAEDEIMAVFNR